MQDMIVFMQHHVALSIAFLIVLVFLFFLEFLRLKQKASALSPAGITQLINRQNAVVIDTRSRESFAEGHIVDAVSMPLSELKTPDTLEKFKGRPIILVCNTGLEAPRIAQQLKEKGHTTYVLNGGIQAWRRAELPLVKG